MVALAQLDLQSLFVGLYWMDLIDLEVLPDKLWDGTLRIKSCENG